MAHQSQSFSRVLHGTVQLFGFIFLGAFASGCNLFDPLDSPTHDAQLISAARVCFDDKDFVCAREYYEKLSASESDVKNSELAFMALSQAGIGMAEFMDAFGEGEGAAAFKRLAEKLVVAGTNTAAGRLAIYSAFSRSGLITYAPLRGLVRFATSSAMVAQILSESVGSNGVLEKADLAADPVACQAASGVACATEAGCLIGGTGTLAAGSTAINLANTTAAVVEATPTLQLLHSAIEQVNTALSANELGAGGKFSTGVGSFSSEFGTVGAAIATDSGRCYRKQLLDLKIAGE